MSFNPTIFREAYWSPKTSSDILHFTYLVTELESVSDFSVFQASSFFFFSLCHAEAVGIPDNTWSWVLAFFASDCQDSGQSMYNHRIQNPVLANSVAGQDLLCDFSILCNKKTLWTWCYVLFFWKNNTKSKCPKFKIQDSLHL